jgi:hypothetical protein
MNPMSLYLILTPLRTVTMGLFPIILSYLNKFRSPLCILSKRREPFELFYKNINLKKIQSVLNMDIVKGPDRCINCAARILVKIIEIYD